MRPFSFLLMPTVICFVLISSCKQDRTTLFSKLSEEQTGVDFRNMLEENEQFNVLNYAYFYNGGGVAIGDINNDGLPDLLFTGNMVPNRLYLNKGNFAFEDITEESGIAAKEGWCTGATMVDINGDGYLDIYICRSADSNPNKRKNLLFINDGHLRFSEQADQYGLADNGYSTQAAFFDFDKDGDLDLFVINHSLQEYLSGLEQHPQIRKQQNPNFSCKMYRNDNGHYSNISAQAGITSNVLTFALGLAISDINKDGWPDIYVSNDFNEPDYLFINNKNGTFTDKLAESLDYTSLYSMGSDIADFNNDGLPDIQTLDMLPESNELQKMHSGSENFNKMQYFFNSGFYYQFSRNMLQKNNGDGTFSEIGQLAGVSNTDWSWAALFSDFDNDGFKDLFVTNGYVKDYTNMDFLKYTVDQKIRSKNEGKKLIAADFIREMPTIQIPNYIFQNQGNETFVKRSAAWGFDQSGVSSGAAYADLDNDGDLDLVTNNIDDFAGIYQNNSEVLSANHYLKIKLAGDRKNPSGIGAKVSVFYSGHHLYQEQSPVRGFESSVDQNLIVGIGKEQIVDSLIITWPDDRTQKLFKVRANQTISCNQADSHLPQADQPVINKPFFSETNKPILDHLEKGLNDFDKQSLLTSFLSRSGPSMAIADVDGDKRTDLFIDGGAGEGGRLFLQSADGNLLPSKNLSLQIDSLSDHHAAEFFDADGDGDQDLYLGSGDYQRGNAQAHLYINNGQGHFAEKPGALPAEPGCDGVAKAADVDGDGDLDLFIGGRLTPGKYPLTPSSGILLNNGKGDFSNAASSISPGLENIGMVTDAAWININSDALPDLVIVGEWMPVKVFINTGTQLLDSSSHYVPFASSGWWNTLLAEDFDHDGDLDLIIGNQGLNGQIHPSPEQPVTMYAKDFDENGSIDPILCYYIGGISYPAVSMDELLEQLPMLKKKFYNYKTYSAATIKDLFTSAQLTNAKLLQAQTFHTTYLENRGASGFVQHELPVETQYAPVYALSAIDADMDGNKDLILAGNNSWSRIKYGHQNASHGILLLGDGKGNFKYVPQPKSGLNVRKDVRSMKVINTTSAQKVLFGVNGEAVMTYQLNK